MNAETASSTKIDSIPWSIPWKVRIFDFILIALLSIWVAGGIPWGGKLYLKHGADPRRAAIIFGILGYYLFPALRSQSRILKLSLNCAEKLTQARHRWGLFWGFGVAFSILAILQTLALRVPLYDVGIFHQILWSLSQGLGFHSTISGAGNFLMDHFSPSLALYVPFFWLSGGSPFFLPILQTFLLLGGGAAWIYLAERVPEVDPKTRSTLAAATTVFLLSFESFYGNLRWGFHENNTAFFTTSWALALLLTRSPTKSAKQEAIETLFILALLLISAFSKEILLLDVAIGLFVWAIHEWKTRRWTALLLLFAGLGLVATFVSFENLPHPADKNYFDRYYSYLGRDLATFLKSVFFSPWKFIQTLSQAVGFREIFKYFFVVFLPWLFLPWIAFLKRTPQKNPQAKVFNLTKHLTFIILPSFASALLATYPPLRGSHFHYVLELWPVLAVVSIITLSHFRSQKLFWVWTLFSLITLDQDPLTQFREYAQGAVSLGRARDTLTQIPSHLSVMADELAGPWVAGREWVTRWPDAHLLPEPCPDVFVLRAEENSRQGEALQNCPKSEIVLF